MIIEQRVASSADDAEEAASGAMYLNSTDLELVDDTFNGSDQTVGIRFAGLDIPQGAIITKAWLQFQVDEADSEVTSLEIRAHDTDDAGAFTAADNDISSRATTSAAVAWQPRAWTVVGEAGHDQRTPNLRDVVQEIVDRQGWVANNDLAFIITGTGERTAESYDGNPVAAPLLHIEYMVPQPENAAPTAITLPNAQTVIENAAGVVIGALSVDDPDTGDSHTFSVSDARFEVVGNQLKLTDGARFDFEAGAEVSVDVTATDSGGLQITESFTISVEDVPEIRFAAFGDYSYRANTQAVADLVDSLNVDFIITTGDNAYRSVPIDVNIGQFYADYIGDYTGSYGSGSAINRFFPSLGNHEYRDDSAGPNGTITTYLDYFTLPGNERYYEFQMGAVHFFAVNSNPEEPDGNTVTSTQAQWLQSVLAASTAAHKVVYFHHPVYSSGVYGSASKFQWPFEEWGATAVLNGHEHSYERIVRDDNSDGTELPYLVSGLGGHSFRNFGNPPVEGSEARFTGDFGTVLVQASDSTMTFEFVSIEGGGTVVDRYTIELPGTNPLTANDNDRLNGGTGDDFMNGLSGDDVLFGGQGNDTLYGGDGVDRLYGNDGDDRLHGGDGLDWLYGHAGDDRLYGDAGDDRLYGYAGEDKLYGGAGDDWLFGNDDGDRLEGGDGIDRLLGGNGDDQLFGGAGNDRLYGGDNRDLLVGGDGNDRLYGGDHRDLLYGGAGNDELYGNKGHDELNGGSGNDELYGGNGHDELTGGTGNDELRGGNGRDELRGGTGDDRLTGGNGDDVFVFGTGSGRDTITDFTAGAGAGDTILFNSSTGLTSYREVLANAADDGTSTTITIDAENSVVLQNVVVSDLNADDFPFV